MNATDSSEVGVVGASLAGLYAAHLLAEGGRHVRVYEGMRSVDPPERSLIVTSAYRDLLGEIGESAILNEIRTFELYADGMSARIELDRPDIIIERAALMRSLLASAEGSGAEIVTGRQFHDLAPDGSGIELRFTGSGSTARARTVIGADGSSSRVAKSAGMRLSPVAPLMQAIIRLPDDMTSDRTRVWFVPDETPYFYWLIPDSDTTGALGIIGCDGRETRRCLDAFVERKGFELIEYQGARIPEYHGWNPVRKRIGNGDVYLVGDAAGHVKVTTVGGVVNGLWGAEGVVDDILGRGRRRLRSLRLELGLHLLIRRALHHFGEDDYRELLGMLDRSSKRTLGRYTRDQTFRLMVDLLLKRPRFALLGLRGLLSSGFPNGNRSS